MTSCFESQRIREMDYARTRYGYGASTDYSPDYFDENQENTMPETEADLQLTEIAESLRLIYSELPDARERIATACLASMVAGGFIAPDVVQQSVSLADELVAKLYPRQQRTHAPEIPESGPVTSSAFDVDYEQCPECGGIRYRCEHEIPY